MNSNFSLIALPMGSAISLPSMDTGLLSTLFALGWVGGFLSGLLGIGGGIVMVPLLLYVPPALGVGLLSMKTVAGMTSVQSFFAAISGAIGHKRHQNISLPLAMTLGTSLAIGSLVGSLASVLLTSELMLMVFASLAMVAALMMLIPQPENGPEIPVAALRFNKPLAIGVGLVVGGLSGIVGQGGAFIFIPAMLYVLLIPTRITIGTALVVGIASSVAVLLGRLGTQQVPYGMAIVLVLGALLGAQLGSALSQKTTRRHLHTVLSVIIAITALKMWYELLKA